MTTCTFPAPQAQGEILDKRDLAELLGCSTRHIERMADDGRMPKPVHIGKLVRWRRTAIDEWLAAGCPAVDQLTA